MKKGILLLLLCALLCGCSEAEEAPPTETVPTTAPMVVESVPAAALEAEAVALAEAPPPAVSVVLVPEAPGTLEKRCETAVVDYSHTEEGYIMACYTAQTETRLKVQVKGPKTTYTYNLTPEQWTVFPLSDGDGSYQTVVYENVRGSQYAAVLSASFPVTLRDEFAPFLGPNQYVNYTDATRTVDTGAVLCAGLDHPLEKVAAVYDFVVGALSYDYDKAETVKSGYLPDLDAVLAAEKGICFDYAALMTAMLRSQQVPCKLVVGYAGSTYHAWISVWAGEEGWIDGAIFFDGVAWKRMDPTFASSQHKSEEIMEFIEHGSYTVKYLY